MFIIRETPPPPPPLPSGLPRAHDPSLVPALAALIVCLSGLGQLHSKVVSSFAVLPWYWYSTCWGLYYNWAVPLPIASPGLSCRLKPCLWCQISASLYNSFNPGAFHWGCTFTRGLSCSLITESSRPLRPSDAALFWRLLHNAKFGCQYEVQPWPAPDYSFCLVYSEETLPRGAHLVDAGLFSITVYFLAPATQH